MTLRRVAVFMGGISSEHPVSLRSGAGMLQQLDTNRFIGFPVLIGLDNVWKWPKSLPSTTLTLSAEVAAEILKKTPPDWQAAQFPHFSEWPACDIALLALHGVGGEDGRLQGFFELAGLPYTGSSSSGSSLSMDKITSKHLYRSHQIPTAPFRTLSPEEWQSPSLDAKLDALTAELGLPIVVKHPKGGSSLGMGIAKTREDLGRLTRELTADTDALLFESFVKGREVTCGVLEGHAPLAPTEIRPKQDGFFTYEAKYQHGRTEEITPAPMPENLIRRIQNLAWQCHRALRLNVYSRTDMIVSGEDIFVLETNNLPGFTPTSILPQQAHYAGLSYRDLLTHILDQSWLRFSSPASSTSTATSAV